LLERNPVNLGPWQAKMARYSEGKTENSKLGFGR
jgi:hypothetical protein